MNAVEYLKERCRMTNDCKISCWDCPISTDNNKTSLSCDKFEHTNPEQAVKIVEKWAKENPVKTCLSVLLEKFPRLPLDKGLPRGCPSSLFVIDNGCPTIDNYTLSCAECWNREVKEEI